MSQSVLKQMSEQIDETSHKAYRAASAVADALQDGVETVRCAAKHGEHVATELFYDTKMRVRRHPVESVLATFVVGLAAGALIVHRITRKAA
jgi:ElaB/YqjD/DUF883 family membrane-anchored ribosome-binding protein